MTFIHLSLRRALSFARLLSQGSRCLPPASPPTHLWLSHLPLSQVATPAIKTSSDATGKLLGKKQSRRKDVERKPGIDRRNRSVLSPDIDTAAAPTTNQVPLTRTLCVPWCVARAGETQVMRAVHDNDMATVKVLIADGADVNITCNAGWTPLHESGNFEITKLLLEAEADPNVRQLWHALGTLLPFSPPAPCRQHAGCDVVLLSFNVYCTLICTCNPMLPYFMSLGPRSGG